MLLMSFLILTTFILGHSTNGELKGRYTRNVNDYEIVVPQKVSENGRFISYYLPHFYNEARARRGADTGKVHYAVPIRGSQRMLELLPAEDFHGPGLVVEHHENNARMSMEGVKVRRPSKLNCYYHGWVKDEPSSSAAITTCSGLAGAITIGSVNYLIEPIDDDNLTNGPQHWHIIFKSEYKREIHNSSICGTTQPFAAAFEERMKWEEKYGKMTRKAMMGDDTHFQTIFSQNNRSKKWCTTCKPKQFIQRQSPSPPCEIERPLFLELAIVLGPRAATNNFLVDDMEQYINTLINIAAKHFQDSSLRRPIQIKLVRLITLGFLYEDLDSYRYKPEDLLKRFCEWQTHFNPPREAHPNHHDFILYLVKFSECSGSMQGLTNMASICRPDKACGIVNLEGLLTGHIITHMLGHSMGADHDDENVSGCLPEEPDGTCYLMAQHICSRSTTWSHCSRHCISKFTSTQAAWCMSDIPTAHDFTDPSLLPGQVYSAAEQCRINFEIDTNACLVGEFCKHLFCKISDNECVSTGEPPAQGTRCGPDQWCFNQKCVHRGSRPGATNGEWGTWSQWTPCTKTCGGGVQTANRACDSPPPSNGGRKCPGQWLKSRMCNIGSCPDAGKGFLDQQCKNTNSKPYHGRKHEWLYFNQQVEDLQCVVTCKNENNEVAVRSPLAIDGTYCKPGTKDVCIRGQCHSVGCDWVIGSKSKEDACGVCHGNGTECKVLQGYFTELNFQGRIPFLKLPIGTSMILMRETRPSPCFFVIANSLNSSYYLNSDDAEDRTTLTGAFMITYTTGIYQLKANMERIFIKDPLRVPITVSLLCRNLERSIGILYQYALPEPSSPDMKPHYTWEFLSWEKCPQLCGGAVQRATPVCVEAQGGEVEDSYCSIDTRPADRIRVCNQRPCEAKWWVGPWSECDCYMKDGIKTRMVMCAHLKAARSHYITIVKEEECIGEDKPFSEKPCDKDAESKFWEKKGERKKRDYMDLVPYSMKTENYSVWDEELDDSIATVNVRDLFQAMDPENVKDYVYLKGVGLTPAFREKMEKDLKRPNARIRRRKAIVKTKETYGKSSSKELSNKENDDGTKGNSNVEQHLKAKKDTKQTKMKANQQKGIENEPTEKKGKLEQARKVRFKLHEQGKIDNKNTSKVSPLTTNPIMRMSIEKIIAVSTLKANTNADKPKETMKNMNNKKNDAGQKERLSKTENPLKMVNNRVNNHEKYPSLNNDAKVNAAEPTEKKHKRKQKESHPEYLSSSGKKVNAHSTPKIYSTEAMEDNGFQDITHHEHITHHKSLKTACTKFMTREQGTNQFSAAASSLEEATHQPTHSVSSKYSTKPHKHQPMTSCGTNEKVNAVQVNKKYVIEVENLLTNPVTVAIRQHTNLMTEVLTPETSATQNEMSLSQGRMASPSRKVSLTDTSVTLTVPEMKITPGLTPFTMYATEKPPRMVACWQTKMKDPKKSPTCVHQDGEVVEPAEDPPEWDFVNTNNVKIFVVPIHTTLRTVIQNDNEFVLMETLAQYPVAEEMNTVEHTGEAARRKLKIAAQKGITKSRLIAIYTIPNV